MKLNMKMSNWLKCIGDMKEKNRYFFSKGSTMGINGSGSGYWKPIGKEKKIVASSGTNQILGSRKSLAFYESKKKKKKTSHDHPHATKTRWIMHEYRLSIPPTTQVLSQTIPFSNGYSIKLLENIDNQKILVNVISNF